MISLVFSGFLGISSSVVQPEIWGYSEPGVSWISQDSSSFHDPGVIGHREKRQWWFTSFSWNHKPSCCWGSFFRYRILDAFRLPLLMQSLLLYMIIWTLGHERMEKIFIFIKRITDISTSQNIRIPFPSLELESFSWSSVCPCWGPVMHLGLLWI